MKTFYKNLKPLPIAYKYVWLTVLILILLSLSESYFTFRLIVHFDSYPWLRKILINVTDYGTWGLLIPFIYNSLPRIEDYRERKLQILSSQFFYLLMYLGLQMAISSALMYTPLYFLRQAPFAYADTMPFFPDLVLNILESMILYLPQEVIARFIEYAVIAGIFMAIDYYQKYQRKTLEVSKMEVELGNARLKALKAQLNPHFLFNALNSISSLIDQDQKSAQTMISRLGDLLRQVLYEKTVHMIPLRQELDYVRSYLDIEEVRFGDRLKVVYKMDPKSLDHLVPSFILQPLVENAIKHGFAGTIENVEVHLISELAKDKLLLEVRDNGMGINEENSNPEGVGLQNLKLRLEQLYGNKGRFSLIPLDKGVNAKVEIPISLI